MAEFRIVVVGAGAVGKSGKELEKIYVLYKMIKFLHCNQYF